MTIKSVKKIILNRYFVIGVIFVAGLLVGHFVNGDLRKEGAVQGIAPFREKSNDYKFINPLLFYDSPNSNSALNYLPIVNKIKEITSNFERQEKDGQISTYYRDLNKGQWIEINEDKTYTPSSLLKVVVMIAYFKKMETNPAMSVRSILFSKDIQNTMAAIPYDRGTNLVIGQKYTVEDLINKMIIDSDNGAVYALLSEIDDTSLDQIYANLDLKNPKNTGRSYTITPEGYVLFLRILYNATYLNRAMSEKALALLSRTNFNDGIAASIPRSIKIAHKYGETVVTKDGKDVEFVELHDCGIVYHLRTPYILCVMSRGSNLDNLSNALKTISTAVYQYVNSR